MSVSIQLEDAAAMAALDKLAQNVQDVPTVIEMDAILFMDSLVATAQATVPVKTGKLQASIHWEGDFPEYQFIADALNESGNSYAAYVEYGTSQNEAQPYMWPAIEANIDIFRDRLTEDVRQFILES